MSYERTYKYLRHYLIACFSTTLLLASVVAPQIQLADAYRETIVEKSIRLSAGDGITYQFSSPYNAVNVRLTGSVDIVGGIIPQILVYLVEADRCAPPSGNALLCNSYYIKGYYGDGDTVSLYLPAGRTFYLAFYNTAILGERKIVDASFYLEYR
jgi:hypothetical protein